MDVWHKRADGEPCEQGAALNPPKCKFCACQAERSGFPVPAPEFPPEFQGEVDWHDVQLKISFDMTACPWTAKVAANFEHPYR